MDWIARKKARKEHYQRFVMGKKFVTCTACNGSGHYDNDKSPPCACCNGTGKVRSGEQ